MAMIWSASNKISSGKYSPFGEASTGSGKVKPKKNFAGPKATAKKAPHQARLCEGGDNTVSFTRKPDLVDPVEVPNSPSSHRMTISSVLRRSNVGAREREAGIEAHSWTDRGPAYVARPAGWAAGKRGP